MIEYNIDYSIPCMYEDYCMDTSSTCKKTCHRYLEITFLFSNCGMKTPEKYTKELIPDDVDKNVFEALNQLKLHAKDYIESGRNLFIQSINPQTGKTSWALKIMYTYFHYVWCYNGFKPRGYFVYVPDLIMNLKDFEYRKTSEYKQLVNILKTVDVVIWDDLNLLHLTSTESDLLYTLVHKRIQDNKTNIVTGVHQEESKLLETVGENLGKRLVKFNQIVLRGGSKC